MRGWWDTLLGRASASGARREVGPALRTIESHERGLLVGAAVLGGLVLVLWTHPTGFVVLLVLILTLAVMAAIRLAAEVVRRSDAEEAPDDRPGEAPDDRPGGDVADATDDEPAVSDSTHT